MDARKIVIRHKEKMQGDTADESSDKKKNVESNTVNAVQNIALAQTPDVVETNVPSEKTSDSTQMELLEEMQNVRSSIPSAEGDKIPNALKTDNSGNIENAMQSASAEKIPDNTKTDELASQPLENKWEQLFAIYPHIAPFGDEREYLSLGPEDFVIFPAKYYQLVNNSFLLHGYHNYNHLILTRIIHRGEIRYYIGVPGNYYEKEKQVAIMFGFESFECKTEPVQQGDYGYYMMRIEV